MMDNFAGSETASVRVQQSKPNGKNGGFSPV